MYSRLVFKERTVLTSLVTMLIICDNSGEAEDPSLKRRRAIFADMKCRMSFDRSWSRARVVSLAMENSMNDLYVVRPRAP
ncbi:hypothetical protein DFH29DRAFT_943783 [Suillus ampliporus]|nr:hypothetical protein DFH29DRAFT_943783 [Suillus ampliporus]